MDILYKFSYIFNSLFLIATNGRFLRQKIIMPRRSVLTELEKSILLKIPIELVSVKSCSRSNNIMEYIILFLYTG